MDYCFHFDRLLFASKSCTRINKDNYEGENVKRKIVVLVVLQWLQKKKAATKSSHNKKVQHPPPQNMLALKTSLSTIETTVLLNHVTSKWLLKCDNGHQKQQLIQPLPNSCRGNGILASSMFPCFLICHLKLQHISTG